MKPRQLTSHIQLGKLIKKRREDKKWSQTELATKASAIGMRVTQQVITDLEKGKRKRCRVLPEIAHALDTTSDALLKEAVSATLSVKRASDMTDNPVRIIEELLGRASAVEASWHKPKPGKRKVGKQPRPEGAVTADLQSVLRALQAIHADVQAIRADQKLSMAQSDVKPEADRWLRLPEVLKMVGISKTTLYRWVEAGEFPPSYELGRNIRAWKRDDIEKWLRTRPRRR